MPRPPAQIPDWLLGAPGKRLVLTRVFDEGNETREWTERALHEAVGAERHASLGKHLEGLARLGLMREMPMSTERVRRYRLIPPDQLDPNRLRVRDGLRQMLPALARLDEAARAHGDGR